MHNMENYYDGKQSSQSSQKKIHIPLTEEMNMLLPKELSKNTKHNNHSEKSTESCMAIGSVRRVLVSFF